MNVYLVRAAIVLCALSAVQAAEKVTYLALGDSVTFGYSPLVTVPIESNYSGYPERIPDFASPLKWESNLGCPGETTASFLSLTASERGCRDFRSRFGLHTNYTGTQMEEALATLRRESQHMKLVSVQLGANDLLLVQERCNFDPVCTAAGIPQAVANAARNLGIILTRLRQVYRGPLVLVNYYSPDYRDPLQTGGVMALRTALAGVAASFDATVADAFMGFAVASLMTGGDTCAAGLLIRMPNGTCDVHPSPRGRDLLAALVLMGWRRAD